MKVTTEYDPNGKEWVLRLHSDNGSYWSLGGLVAEDEANLVQTILQGALELHLQASDENKRFDYTEGFRKGMKNADNIVEGRLLLKFAGVKS